LNETGQKEKLEKYISTPSSSSFYNDFSKLKTKAQATHHIIMSCPESPNSAAPFYG